MLTEQVLASDQVMISSKGFVPGIIRISGSEIVAVETCEPDEYSGKLKSWQSAFPNLKDLQGYAITPGFINAHTHIAMNLFRGIDCESSTKGNMVEDLFYHIESRLSREDILAFARIGAIENLLNGNLLVWDHYYFGDAVAQALAETGLTGVVAPTLQDVRGPGKSMHESGLSQTLEIHQSEELRGKGIFAALGPHATDTVSEKLWLSVLDMAKKHALPVHSHHSQSAEEFNRSIHENACSPGLWLKRIGAFGEGIFHTLVHNIFTKDTDFSLYQDPGVTLVSCPFSALVFSFPALVTDWEKNKLRWTLGTDCVASNDSMNLQKELRYIAGFPIQKTSWSPACRAFGQGQESGPEQLQRVRRDSWEEFSDFRKPEWLLEKLWDRPGRMHPGFSAGSISSGSLANLIVWDCRHPSLWPFHGLKNLAMGDTTQSIHNAMAAGQWLGRDGSYHQAILERLDYQELIREAGARFRQVLKKCGL